MGRSILLSGSLSEEGDSKVPPFELARLFSYIDERKKISLQDYLTSRLDPEDLLTLYNEKGFSLLHYACYSNSYSSALLLINFVAYGHKGWDFCDEPEEAVLKRRERTKSFVNAHLKNEEGFTPLHFASYHGNPDLIDLLIKNGADMGAVNEKGINMVHVAAQGDKPYSILFFSQNGLSIEAKDNENSTALHWACT